jgi:hypothetical protein
MKKLTSQIKKSLRKERPAPSRASHVPTSTISDDGMTQVATLSANQLGIARSTSSNVLLTPLPSMLTAGPSNLSDSGQVITASIEATHPVANPLPSADLVSASSASASTVDLASNAPSLATSPGVATEPSLLPRTTISAYILKEALERLDPKERASLQDYTSSSTADAKTALNAAYQAARDKQAACRATPFVWRLGKHSVELRDIANRVVKWLDRFKSVLDVAVSADPIHATLPWVGVRVLLEVRPSPIAAFPWFLSPNTIAYSVAYRLPSLSSRKWLHCYQALMLSSTMGVA